MNQKKPSTLPKSTANFIIERIAQLIRAYIQHERNPHRDQKEKLSF